MHHPGGGDASEQNLEMPKRVLEELTGREGKAKTENGNVKGSYSPTGYSGTV